MDVDPINVVDLNSVDDSTIKSVHLYPTRAQITRAFKLNVRAGQNRVVISYLPNVVDSQSLRVEGRGPATILGVSSSTMERGKPQQTSPRLDELNAKKAKVKNALSRCKKARKALDNYIGKIDIQHLDVSKLGEAMDVYDTTEEKWDDKIVVIALSATLGAEIMIDLTYDVARATWKAAYDIRVDMQNPSMPAKVIYKAIITQQTGEVWEDVPITLEIAAPTFGAQAPQITAWYIDVQNPRVDRLAMRSRFLDMEAEVSEDEECEEPEIEMVHTTSFVTTTGNINATFRIPTATTVPTDNQEHSVIIADLDLEATMTWLCVPKSDTRASIKNSSDYTFISGNCNVFVDQSFIARSYIPHVSPQETFECDLGLDPSIRITYHSSPSKVSESGFYAKSRTHASTQRITIHNTKPIAIAGLKITDHVPVSRNANIAQAAAPVRVAEGVVAQWNGADAPNADVAMLGKDGRLDWICAVPAFSKINLVLQWEVSAAPTVAINGL
ncbi:hypothetical protein BDZ97DRAFT_1759956 [Flammula alnicola]|nr:hypothetical protein BDZ97DRAFT_1759956 [Flammula alnicola]